MSRVPDLLDDPDRFRRAWNDLPFAERRRISRAVNKGEALDDELDAQLAVVTARRQVRFWSWAWAIGPAFSFLQFLGQGVLTALTTSGIAAVVTGLLSIWFLRRARRAEQANLELATRAKRRGAPHPLSKEARREQDAKGAGLSEAAGSWLPRRRRRR